MFVYLNGMVAKKYTLIIITKRSKKKDHRKTLKWSKIEIQIEIGSNLTEWEEFAWLIKLSNAKRKM